MTDLTQIARDAAALIEERGWTQEEFEDEDGALCLHGAVRACTPMKGDAEIVRAVLRHKGFTEGWNDFEAEKADVLNALRAVEVTDADLAEIFGPQWREIVALVRRAASLTEDEITALFKAISTTRSAARESSNNAVWYAARDAARNEVWYAARAMSSKAVWYAARESSSNTPFDVAWDLARDVAWYAARNTAAALSVRDLIGQHGFTQEHYDTLTKLWATTIGKVHPDD